LQTDGHGIEDGFTSSEDEGGYQEQLRREREEKEKAAAMRGE